MIYFFLLLINSLSFGVRTAVRNPSQKIVLYSLLREKEKYCIYCYFMATFIKLLGKTKAHGSRGKITTSRSSLIKDNTIA